MNLNSLKHRASQALEVAALSLAIAIPGCASQKQRTHFDFPYASCLQISPGELRVEDISDCTHRLIAESGLLIRKYQANIGSPDDMEIVVAEIDAHITNIRRFIETLSIGWTNPTHTQFGIASVKATTALHQQITYLGNLTDTEARASSIEIEDLDSKDEISDFIARCSSLNPDTLDIDDIMACTKGLDQITYQYEEEYFIRTGSRIAPQEDLDFAQALQNYQELLNGIYALKNRLSHMQLSAEKEDKFFKTQARLLSITLVKLMSAVEQRLEYLSKLLK